MAQTLEELLVAINASTDKLRAELAEGDRSVKKFGRDVDTSLGKVDSRFNSLTRSVKGFVGALGLGLGISAIARESAQSLRALEEVGRQADSLGASVESIQELTLTFREFDLESNDVSDALGTVADRAQDAKDGMKSFIDDFKLLGVSVDDLRGKRPEELFGLIAERVATIEDPTRRTAGIVRIFGDDLGRRLNPLLLQGREGLEKYAERWRDLGAVVDEAGVRTAGEAAEKFRELQTSIGGKFQQVVADNAENIRDLADALLSVVDVAAKVGGSVSSVTSQFGQGLGILVARAFGTQDADDLLANVNQSIQETQREIAKLLSQLDAPAGRFNIPIDAEEARDQLRLLNVRLEQLQTARDILQRNAGSFGFVAESGPRAAGEQAGRDFREGFRDAVVDIGGPLTSGTLIPGLTADQVFPTRDIVDGVFEELEDKAADTAVVIDDDFSRLAESIGGSLQRSFSDALRGIETDFGDVLARMAADLIASELLGLLGGLIPGQFGKALTAGLPGFASGGRFQAGRPFAAGERGTEIIVPDVSGQVMTAAQTERMMRGGGGGVVVNMYNAPSHPQTRERTQGGVRIVDIVFPSIMDDLGKNGPLTQAIGARFGLNPAFSSR